MGTAKEMQNSTHPRVRQFMDRVPEPAVAQELDYLQMLTEQQPRQGSSSPGKSR
jgi:phospholipid/cholesterol/gamma-HCH transport system ATP-binding protein